MSAHVVDASAVLAFLGAEPGWQEIARGLDQGMLSAVNLGEVSCKVVDHGRDPVATARDLREFGLIVVDLTPTMASNLPVLRAADRHAQAKQAAAGVPARRRKRLSLADLCCLALALDRSAPVITGDEYWSTLDLLLKIENYRTGVSLS